MVCTGGYALDFDIFQERQPTIFKTLSIAFGFPGATGDGFRALSWAGAQMTEMPTSMLFDRGAIMPSEQPGNPAPMPVGMWTFSSQPWLKVNANGERFTCESCLYDMIIHAATYQPGNVYYDIWDSDWAAQIDSFTTVGCSEIVKRRGGCDLDVYYTDTATDEEFEEFVQGERDEIAAQMESYVEEGRFIKADTIEELAEGMGLPPQTLAATVARYNELAEKGVDEDFGKEPHRLLPLVKPPFYASKMASWVLCTADGAKQTPKHEAIDADGNPIPGLYVGGVDASSVFANSYPNLSSGMCCGHSVTFGYRAGKIISHNDDPDYEPEIPITF
jgi:succinate dehydrogenase/fumarate reductase flavoprotein subunit